MIMDQFDRRTLANMQLALEQASKQFPARLRTMKDAGKSFAS
jgi:hypothetical protein